MSEIHLKISHLFEFRSRVFKMDAEYDTQGFITIGRELRLYRTLDTVVTRSNVKTNRGLVSLLSTNDEEKFILPRVEFMTSYVMYTQRMSKFH